eukprot:6087327-Alexandrium_andersonii.AAC.1
MSASLVGSEMCIRDRPCGGSRRRSREGGARAAARSCGGVRACSASCCRAVSYTHLTLPTICSV